MGEHELVSQLTSAAVVVYALQWMKRSKLFPWVCQEKKTILRALSAVGAALSAVGIHFAFATVEAASGTYTITISGLTLLSVLHGTWHWVNQLALQQLAYDATLDNKKPASVPPAAPNQPVVTVGG